LPGDRFEQFAAAVAGNVIASAGGHVAMAGLRDPVELMSEGKL
jgi:hypothetical protein